MSFNPFDPSTPVQITHGNLPHWFQPNATHFITFRTTDSIPIEVAKDWRAERDNWLQAHGIALTAAERATQLGALPDNLQREYHMRFSHAFLEHLDACHGACLLRKPELSQIVADSLLRFDGDRYFMGDFVVMPNHVHLLVRFAEGVALKSQCDSWKRFTSTRINDRVNRSGSLWQTESFDHIVRNAQQFQRLRYYIEENPKAARLRVGEYRYYRSAE